MTNKPKPFPAQQKFMDEMFGPRVYDDLPTLAILLAGRRAGKSMLAALAAERVVSSYLKHKKALSREAPRNTTFHIFLSEEIMDYAFREGKPLYMFPLDNDQSIVVSLAPKKFEVKKVRGVTCAFAALNDSSWLKPHYDEYDALLTAMTTTAEVSQTVKITRPVLLLGDSPASQEDWLTNLARDEDTPLSAGYNRVVGHYTSWDMNPHIKWSDIVAQGISYESFVRDFMAYKLPGQAIDY